MRRIVITAVLACVACTAFTQSRNIQAVKIAQPPKPDGHLDDAAWQNVPVATDFIVNSPSFGAPASRKTEVKIVYDDAAVYVGALLHDEPTAVLKQLTARDREEFQNTDFFLVAFDTYNDNQNAFQFTVTAANVQSDKRHSPLGDDNSWDAVWDSRVAMLDSGWSVEIKIPYSAIRFSGEAVQDWGVNFGRFIRRLNESSFWDPIDPKISGYVNQFGNLKGLQDIKPPTRLSFLPYISLGYSTVPGSSGSINQFIHNGGMDVKYGVSESFTLDMTLIPDFGQVQSDNVVLNLSPFEQQFNEHRPFFTEGTELFNKAGIFYSRRVGAMPSGYGAARRLAADSGYEIIRNPSVTQLYNGTKFSGRTRKNLGIGVFNAVTAPMHAEFRNSKGEKIEMETEPLTNYNIIVLDQALKGRSFVSFTNTNVIRNGSGRDANVSAVDVSLYDKRNMFHLRSNFRFSYVTGSDAHNGFKAYNEFSKIGGKWQWGVTNNIESERYDPNDLGILRAPNRVVSSAYLGYRQFQPSRYFNFRSYNVSFNYISRYKPYDFQEFGINANFFHLFRNFWDVNIVTEGNPVWYYDYFELRTPGRKLRRAPWRWFGIQGSSDSRKKLYWSYDFGFAESPLPKDAFFSVEMGWRYRFNDKFSLEWGAEREHDKGNFGWVDFDNVTGEPIIGRRDVKQFTNLLSAVYNFKARMDLTLRARHYWSKVQYQHFYDVMEDGNWTERPYMTGYDENFNLFNLDMFFTWDFRLGSRLIIAWKNALGPDAHIPGADARRYLDNFRKSFSIPHSNEVSVKFVYYIDYQDLKKKRKL
ncbi:MAG TPA: DUF5916 domain-containing protein [Chitinophagaceae bacterium]